MTAALPEWNGAVLCGEGPRLRRVRSIVLPLDGTEGSRPAIPVAERLRGLYDAMLHVIYIGEEPQDGEHAAQGLGSGKWEQNALVFQRSRRNAAESVMKLASELPDALPVISTGLGTPGGAKDRFGSITESIFARRPLWSVVVNSDRGERPWNLRRILLAHDGTPACRFASSLAADLAKHSGAEVIALHVAAHGGERPREPGSISAPLYVDQPQHEWPAWAEEFMNRLLASAAPESSIHFEFTVSGGRPGSEIAQVAHSRNVDLVVMDWHGHWDHKNCATRVVVCTSGCPVLLVYSADERDG